MAASPGPTSLRKAWLGLGELAAGFYSISVPTGTVRLHFLWRAYSKTFEATLGQGHLLL